MNEIPNSNPQKAIIKDNGSKPTIKNIRPPVMILNVKELKINSKRCPAVIFAANLKPRDTLRARYDTNSIRTRRGTSPRGQPAGTNREKNWTPCVLNPRIVAPSTILKLKEKVKRKCEVEAKL